MCSAGVADLSESAGIDCRSALAAVQGVWFHVYSTAMSIIASGVMFHSPPDHRQRQQESSTQKQVALLHVLQADDHIVLMN